MSAERRLHHFLLLGEDEQCTAIQRMARSGWSSSTIAAATGLAIEQVQIIVGAPSGANPASLPASVERAFDIRPDDGTSPRIAT